MTARRKQGVSAARLWIGLWRDLSRSDRRLLKIAAIALVIGSATTAATPFIVGRFVDSVIRHGHVVGLGDAWLPLIVLASALVVISATNVVQHLTVHTVSTSFTTNMRKRVYTALLRWDIARYLDDSKGAVYGRANRGVEGAEQLIKLGAADLLPALLVTLFGIVLALVKFGLLGLAMIVVVPTGFVLVVWQVRSQKGIRVQVNDAKERIDGDVNAWLAGVAVIRTLGVETYFGKRVAERAEKLRRTELRHHTAMGKFDAAKTVNEAVWLIVTLGLAIALKTTTSPGDLASVVLLYVAITTPLRELHRVIDEGSESALQTKNLQDDLAVPHDIAYESMVVEHGEEPEPQVLHDAPAAVSFENIEFTHAGATKPVLRGLTASIKAGERIGIVGASGCGKSTLLKLVARFAHAFEGEIRINGRDVRHICREELVQTIGYVDQRSQLFQGSVRDNLTLGRDIDERDLVAACQRANIHEDIVAMPDGYDTIIGEEGSRLSGGQSQRLCLARALVRTPPIMLLDEPTSALDGPSEAVVQRAIDSLDDVTMLIVAHRLHTLRTMNRILVMNGGRIVEEGSYDELVEAGGPFADMLASERRRAA